MGIETRDMNLLVGPTGGVELGALRQIPLLDVEAWKS